MNDNDGNLFISTERLVFASLHSEHGAQLPTKDDVQVVIDKLLYKTRQDMFSGVERKGLSILRDRETTLKNFCPSILLDQYKSWLSIKEPSFRKRAHLRVVK